MKASTDYEIDLLPSQRNEVFRAITAAGLDPADYWGSSTHRDGAGDLAQVPLLRHRASGYPFEFDLSNGAVRFEPDSDWPVGAADCRGWPQMLAALRWWLESLKREVNQPDLWGMLREGMASDLARAVAAVSIDGGRFTQEERAHALEGVVAIKACLVEHAGSDGGVEERLDLLVANLDRMSRSAWIHTAMGVLVAIVWSLCMDPDRARDLFRFAGDSVEYSGWGSSRRGCPVWPSAETPFFP